MEQNEIPIYKIVVNSEDHKLDYISLVKEPAILELGLAFNKDYKLEFATNKEKQVIVGPAMIPDIPLYRNQEGKQFYTIFSKESIEELAYKFSKSTQEFKINIDHEAEVDSAYVKSSWIIEDKANDKSNMYGFDLPVGTLMIEVKVEDKEFWDSKVKEDGRFGFSVEGLFGLELIETIKKNNTMSKFEEIKLALAELSDEEKALVADLVGAGPEAEAVIEQAEDAATEAVAEVVEEAIDEQVVEEPVVEDEVEEEMAEEVPAPEAVAEVAGVSAEEVSAMIEESKAEMNAKYDELMGLIAELKTLIESKDVPAEVASEMSIDKPVANLEFIKHFRSKYSD